MSWSKNQEVQYQFEKEHDIFFEPSLEEIQAAVTASTAVQRHLNEISHRKPLCMVTGIKWVEGVNMKALHGRTRDGNAILEADATAAGVPLGVGIEGSRTKRVNEEHTALGGSPFIFAIRLKKLTWDRMGDARARDYLDGAFFSIETGGDAVAQAWKLSVEEAVADDFDDSDTVDLIEDWNRNGSGVGL